MFNGKKYVCKLDNCVWSPSEYPSAWEEEREFILNNIRMCSKIYMRGIRDSILSNINSTK